MRVTGVGFATFVVGLLGGCVADGPTQTLTVSAPPSTVTVTVTESPIPIDRRPITNESFGVSAFNITGEHTNSCSPPCTALVRMNLTVWNNFTTEAAIPVKVCMGDRTNQTEGWCNSYGPPYDSPAADPGANDYDDFMAAYNETWSEHFVVLLYKEKPVARHELGTIPWKD